MRFSIGRFCIEITVTDRRKPWELGHISRKRLAEQVLALAEHRGHGHKKIDRIKALREIARDRGWTDFTLRDTKNWVEATYAENGSGAIL